MLLVIARMEFLIDRCKRKARIYGRCPLAMLKFTFRRFFFFATADHQINDICPRAERSSHDCFVQQASWDSFIQKATASYSCKQLTAPPLPRSSECVLFISRLLRPAPHQQRERTRPETQCRYVVPRLQADSLRSSKKGTAVVWNCESVAKKTPH